MYTPFGNCTTGFVTQRDGEWGVVLASHCTSSNAWVGGLQNGRFYQDDDSPESNRITREVHLDHDIHVYNIDHEQCGRDGAGNEYTNCRFSDASFTKQEPGVSTSLVMNNYPTARRNNAPIWGSRPQPQNCQKYL